MSKLAKHTWFNFISFFIAAVLIYLVAEYFTDPENIPRANSDNALADLSIIGASYMAAFVYGLLILIIWSVKVIWTILRLWKKSYLILLNILMLIVPWSPFIAYGAKSFYTNTANSMDRNEVIISKDTYKIIEYDKDTFRGLYSYTIQNDSILLACRRPTYGESDYVPHTKYYLLAGDKLVLIPAERVRHLLNNNGEPYPEERYNCSYQDFKKNNGIKSHPIALNTLEGDSLLKTYLYDTLLRINIDSLEGFERLSHNSSGGSNEMMKNPATGCSIDENGTFYFPFSNHTGWGMGTSTFYIAVKRKNERIQVREVDLAPIEGTDRQYFNIPFSCLMVRNNYIYFLMHHRIYYHKME